MLWYLFLFIFIFFIFGGWEHARGAPFAPGANPVVVTALIARNFSLFFLFRHFYFLTLKNVTYQAIVKFSFDFLAASIPPSTSSVFPFGRQAKVQQCESTIKLWTGSSLSSTKSETKGGKYEVNDVIFCPSSSHSSTNKHRMSEILPESIRPMNKTPNISSFHSISAQLSPSTNEQKN